MQSNTHTRTTSPNQGHTLRAHCLDHAMKLCALQCYHGRTGARSAQDTPLCAGSRPPLMVGRAGRQYRRGHAGARKPTHGRASRYCAPARSRARRPRPRRPLRCAGRDGPPAPTRPAEAPMAPPPEAQHFCTGPSIPWYFQTPNGIQYSRVLRRKSAIAACHGSSTWGAVFFGTGPSTSCNSRKLDVMNIACVLSRRSNSNHFLDLQCRVPGMVFTSCLLGFDSGLSIAPSPAASLSADSDRCKRGSCCCRPSISCKSS